MKKLKQKKLLIVIVSAVLAAAIGAGIFFGVRSGGDPVPVYSFHNVGMTEYWGDSQQTYGPVTTDRIQTVFLTDTQTVTGVKVKDGDMVKEGDVLFTYDTSLSALQLERKRLETEKLRLQLEEAQKKLRELRATSPSEMPEIEIPEMPEPDPGPKWTKFGLQLQAPYDGTSETSAIIYWAQENSSAEINNLLRTLYAQLRGGDVCVHNLPREECPICGTCVHGIQPRTDCPVCMPEICGHGNIEVFCPQCHPCVHGKDPAECEICTPEICEHKNIEAFCPQCHPCVHGKNPAECGICRPALCVHGNIVGMCPECNKYPGLCEHGIIKGLCPTCNAVPNPGGGTTTPDPGTTTTPDPGTTEGTGSGEGTSTTADTLSAWEGPGYRVRLLSATEGGEEVPAGPETFFVVFKMTLDDRAWGTTTYWQGIKVTYSGGDFTVSLFTPSIEDYTYTAPPEVELPEIEMPDMTGPFYSAEELAKLRKEQDKQVKDLELQYKMAQADYKIMQAELGDGNVYAQIDGQVISLLTEEEAKDQNQPMVKVSGGGGFFIKGSVSELEKDRIQIGQTVQVNDWNTGMTYDGTIRDIGDFPTTQGGWMGLGNPNATFYPFTVFVDGEADLQEGMYADMQYSAAESTNGIYLENPFIRTEDGISYVLVRGTNGRLEKKIVTLGKSLWGSYTEVRSGVTEDDYLAFPYGKNVKPGAATTEGDMNTLYGY